VIFLPALRYLAAKALTIEEIFLKGDETRFLERRDLLFLDLIFIIQEDILLQLQEKKIKNKKLILKTFYFLSKLQTKFLCVLYIPLQAFETDDLSEPISFAASSQELYSFTSSPSFVY